MSCPTLKLITCEQFWFLASLTPTQHPRFFQKHNGMKASWKKNQTVQHWERIGKDLISPYNARSFFLGPWQLQHCPSNMHPECWCKDDPFPILSLKTHLSCVKSHMYAVISMSRAAWLLPSHNHRTFMLTHLKQFQPLRGQRCINFQFRFPLCYYLFLREIPLKCLQKCWVWRGTKSIPYPSWSLSTC